MVNIMKMKGFTLIELMIVVAILGILAGLIIPAVRDAQEADIEMPLTMNYMPSDETPTEYIDNDRRSHETVTIQRHSDGSAWACKENAECFEVK